MAQPRIIKGIPVSRGLALGPVHVVGAKAETVPTWSVPGNEIGREIARLQAAIEQTTEELQRRQALVAAQAGAKDAEILSVHRMLLQDPTSRRKVESAIQNQRINAEAAVQQLIDRFKTTLGSLSGEGLHRYAADFSDPWHAVLDVLLKREREQMVAVGEQVILAAAELTPQVCLLYTSPSPRDS